MSARRYRSGGSVYTEDELAIVVWSNPDHRTSPRARALETMTAPDSTVPMAFPIRGFSSNPTARARWSSAFIARTEDSVFESVPLSSRQKPLLVPLPLARRAFGWTRFHVPDEYRA